MQRLSWMSHSVTTVVYAVLQLLCVLPVCKRPLHNGSTKNYNLYSISEWESFGFKMESVYGTGMVAHIASGLAHVLLRRAFGQFLLIKVLTNAITTTNCILYFVRD